MLCRSCRRQRDKNTMRTIVLPGSIGPDLPYVIDICPECMVEFWKYNTKTLNEEIEKVKCKHTISKLISVKDNLTRLKNHLVSV